MNKQLLETHINSLKIAYRKDPKNKACFLYEKQSLSLSELSKKIGQLLSYSYKEVYNSIDNLELEKSIQDYIENKYNKNVNNRAKNQLAKQQDTSLKLLMNKIDGLEPKEAIGILDRQIWSNFFYCEEDRCIYLKRGNRFEYLAPNLPSTKEAIFDFINRYGIECFDSSFKENITNRLKELNSTAIILHNTLLQYKTTDIFTMSNFQELIKFIDDEHKNNPQILTEDYLQGLLVQDFIDNKTPSSIWKGFATIENKMTTYDDEENDKVIHSFSGYYIQTKSNIALTLTKYIEHILSNYSLELKQSLCCLPKMPEFITTSNDIIAKNVLNSEWLNGLIEKPNIEDTLIWNYLKTLNDNQRMFVSAWCYNTILPVKREPINLLLWDKGGTGKNDLLTRTLGLFTKKFYDNEYFRILGKDFDLPTSRFDPKSGKDIADSILVNLDEVKSQQMLDSFADTVGGNSNKISIKKLYSNEYTKVNYSKYILTTNYPLSIKRKEAFQRRLAIIHTYAENTFKLYFSDADYELEFLKDAKCILKYFKSCYEEIISKYNSLVNAASSIVEIQQELDNATDVDENLDEIYDTFITSINGLAKQNDERIKKVKDYYWITNNDWKLIADNIIGTKRYCNNVSIASLRNRFKCTEGITINYNYGGKAKGLKIDKEIIDAVVENSSVNVISKDSFFDALSSRVVNEGDIQF